MNCETLLPDLPRLALDDLDPVRDREARVHLAACESCRSRLDGLVRARAALDLVTVPDAPPLTGAHVRAAAGAASQAESSRPRSFLPRRAAAAAAFVALSATVSLAAGYAGGSLARTPAEGGQEPAVAGDALVTTVEFADAVLALDARLASLEERHERDLLALAQAVDRQVLRRDRGVAEQFDAFAKAAQATQAQIIDTRGAIDDLVWWIQPVVAERTPSGPSQH